MSSHETQNSTSAESNAEEVIIIIGAGASGLACAHKLLEKGVNNIKIIEASERLGGRLKVLKNFADFDIELGGEEIHGNNSEYFNLIKKNGGDVFHYWEENRLYSKYNNEFGAIEDLVKLNQNSEFKKVTDLVEDLIYKLNNTYEDITLKEFLVKNNFSEELFFFANGRIGVEAGTDLNKISIKGFNDLFKMNRSGSCNYLLRNTSHVKIIQKMFKDVLDKIEYNIEITKIDYSHPDKIILNDRKGKTFECQKCVITIPITQLKKLEFLPKLENKFNMAISKIQMDNCAKIILKFKESFWPHDCSYIIIPGTMGIICAASLGKKSSYNILSGLIGGENCRILSNLYKTNREEFIARILSDLEKGMNRNNLKELLVDYYWYDWSEVKFVEGGYSYISVDEKDSREILRENVEGRIWFAGEATAEWGHISTIHGAIESGFRVASVINEINENLNKNLNKNLDELNLNLNQIKFKIKQEYN